MKKIIGLLILLIIFLLAANYFYNTSKGDKKIAEQKEKTDQQKRSEAVINIIPESKVISSWVKGNYESFSIKFPDDWRLLTDQGNYVIVEPINNKTMKIQIEKELRSAPEDTPEKLSEKTLDKGWKELGEYKINISGLKGIRRDVTMNESIRVFYYFRKAGSISGTQIINYEITELTRLQDKQKLLDQIVSTFQFTK